MSTTHVLSRALAVTAAAGLVAGILTAAPAFAADSAAPPSAAAIAAKDKGGAGQGRSVAPSQLAASTQISRSEVINRAASWVGLGLEYSWDNTYQGYRTDCSGYASMAWHLGTPGLDTTSFVPNGVASWISKAELKPGDALLNDAAGALGHIVIFAGWTDSSQSSYDAYEFTGSGVQHRAIPYPYFSGHGTFKPVRNNSIVDDVTTTGDEPVAGNWDAGNGSPAGNVGVFRPSTGQFHLRMDDGSLKILDWGQAGDIPVSANWDGAGPDNIGVFRPSTGQFHLRMDDGSLKILDWGQAGDLPVAGNWDAGNGAPAGNVGVFRPSTGQFHLRMDDGSLKILDWGQAGDIPVSGNWDGAGPDNIGVFRPSTGQFHLRMDDGSLKILDWGQAGDLPVSANFDGGNGAPAGNIGIWRPSTGQFHLRNDDGSLTVLDWGQPR
ncbi:hypothetical protein OU787_27290 [Kitasatospora sp. YST-16]|uniref:hypothetical protein n=1 Tax=Kitasatospora sp. YST-16 TaxID=2998080 RepID=UPI0022840C92|nr:hypothetical protein [Kitasatospora sp. YST-16]WAL74887.1 hypothetical protein OU787_27290 [Kitasatospora sp. YST-16]WNW40943.1 hypothetical protein RKE32_27225 [Streptomyces sp. Li-HN-5-13]